MKKLFAVRGATTVENTKESISAEVCELCNELFLKNKIKSKDIVSIQFTCTKDITALNPATALRKGNCVIDVSKTPLFCSAEPEIDGSLKNCIRVMITTYLKRNSSVEFVYKNGAENLRK